MYYLKNDQVFPQWWSGYLFRVPTDLSRHKFTWPPSSKQAEKYQVFEIEFLMHVVVYLFAESPSVKLCEGRDSGLLSAQSPVPK